MNTDVRRQNRVNLGNTYSQGAWRHRNWSRVVFSDESRFQLFRADGRQRVYGRVVERYARPCVRQLDSFGGGSIMVWGAVRFGWRSQLRIIDGNLTANRYIETVLSPQVTPHMQHHPEAIFMHDNARPHVADVCVRYLRHNNIETLPWKAYSPDINPIKHVWNHNGRRVRARQSPPRTHGELCQVVIKEWHNYPQQQINRLVMSVPRRIREMLRANGGHTRY